MDGIYETKSCPQIAHQRFQPCSGILPTRELPLKCSANGINESSCQSLNNQTSACPHINLCTQCIVSPHNQDTKNESLRIWLVWCLWVVHESASQRSHGRINALREEDLGQILGAHLLSLHVNQLIRSSLWRSPWSIPPRS